MAFLLLRQETPPPRCSSWSCSSRWTEARCWREPWRDGETIRTGVKTYTSRTIWIWKRTLSWGKRASDVSKIRTRAPDSSNTVSLIEDRYLLSTRKKNLPFWELRAMLVGPKVEQHATRMERWPRRDWQRRGMTRKVPILDSPPSVASSLFPSFPHLGLSFTS